MTAALLRVCNKCKVPFLKVGDECNHMGCESCGNEQCFVCSINVTGYSHFGNGPGMCPLFDNTEERLRAEVASAQDRAVRETLDKQGEWTEAEIIVDANLAVGEAARVQQERARREREAQTIARQQLIERMVAEAVAREQNRIQQRTAKKRTNGRAAARRKRRQEEQEERERQERKRERNRRRRARVRERKQMEREAQENQQRRSRKRRRARN
jgi:hypothetical protein